MTLVPVENIKCLHGSLIHLKYFIHPLIVITVINTSLFNSFFSMNNTEGEVNATKTTPVTTTQPPTTTEAPIEEIPEPPEVEQHSSMTIFFILLVVGMILKSSYPQLSVCGCWSEMYTFY